MLIPSRPRLLLLVNESSYFLSHRLNVARAAIEAGMDVHVVTRLTGPVAPIQRYGITVHDVEFPRSPRNPAVEWRTARRLIEVYRRVRPDVVHHFSAKAILLGSIAARRIGARRVVNTFTGLGSAFSGTGWRASCKRFLATHALRRALRPLAWQVTFQNPEDMRQLIDAAIVRPDRCRLIRGSGVDERKYRSLGQPSRPPNVVLAARMIWPKGIGQFVEAARHARSRRGTGRWILAGTSDPENPATVPEDQLRRWHQEGVVRWQGHCDNMVETLTRASVVVLPTYYGEGVPKVLLEAAACGRPIVATNVRGCREIVEHGRNGLLVPPRDAAALVDTVEYLLDRPALCRRMGAEGRKIVLQHFTARHVADQTVRIYRELLGWTRPLSSSKAA